VEHVCDRVGIVREGHLATFGQLDQLAGMRAHRVEIVFAGTPPVERIRAIPGFEQIAIEDNRVSGMFRGEFEPLLATLAGSRVTKFESREPSLEEIFLGFYK
jgi:ABC-2 type transport system ATP-binding protein